MEKLKEMFKEFAIFLGIGTLLSGGCLTSILLTQNRQEIHDMAYGRVLFVYDRWKGALVAIDRDYDGILDYVGFPPSTSVHVDPKLQEMYKQLLDTR